MKFFLEAPVSLPSKPISDHATWEATEHATDSENADRDGIQPIHGVILQIQAIPVLVHVFHEVCDVLIKESKVKIW